MGVAITLDGKTIVSSSYDRTIKLWDLESGQCRATFPSHSYDINDLAITPDGTTAISASDDHMIKVWNLTTGQCRATFEGHIELIGRVAITLDGKKVISSSNDSTLKVWDLSTGLSLATFRGHSQRVLDVAITPDGKTIVSGSGDKTLKVWDSTTGQCRATLRGHTGWVHGVAITPDGKKIISGSSDSTLRVWDLASSQCLATFEGHTNTILDVAIAPDGKTVVSGSSDKTLKVWDLATGQCLATLKGHNSHVLRVAITPDGKTIVSGSADKTLRIWEFDLATLLLQEAESSAHYVNAKVVLVGDTGVGKTGLSLVLNNQPYKETDSTAGRHVWTFDSREVEAGSNVKQTRETLLWDLAGQPGYRVIHQLHLNEVAVALVVFDARSEIDPLAGMRHWERALRLAQQRQGSLCVPMKKFLVSARNDRGGVSIGEDRLQAILKEFGFSGYFKTSAKEGWQIKELREAIEKAIPWENLPEVSSSQLFADIKSFLLDAKKTGLLLSPASQLYDEFARKNPDTTVKVANLKDQFETCIGRLENRDLIRRLTFGGYVLLQPELLDAYASAMVNTAKDEPDGLGSLAEEIALSGKFFVPEEQKIKDLGQEQLLLNATVEELVRHDLALRENANDGSYLVFPSQFNRDYEDAPEPKGKALAITFDGPVQSLYATLAVRLGHSGLFTIGRAEMWRNAAVFTAKAGGRCGIFLQEFAEARGRLILFFDEIASIETRFHFEEFVLAHAKRRALDGTVDLVRFFICPNCGDPVPDSYVKRLRDKGKMTFECPCGGTVLLTEPKERIRFKSKVDAMDKSADWHRDFDAFIMSAKGETSTRSFQEWAGSERVTLSIVFTDVVGSTALGEELRDEAMNEVRRAHFTQSRRLIGQFKGREIKTIGDSFMAAFKSTDAALDYARALQKNTGHPQIRIRAGIHIGPMQVEEGDVFGGAVNFAARVVGAFKGAEIWLSDRAKEDIAGLGADRHKRLKWEQHKGLEMKGFPGKFTLWSVK
jgi:class 3 adenylate cyclase/GTPase SAR1 family protein